MYPRMVHLPGHYESIIRCGILMDIGVGLNLDGYSYRGQSLSGEPSKLSRKPMLQGPTQSTVQDSVVDSDY